MPGILKRQFQWKAVFVSLLMVAASGLPALAQSRGVPFGDKVTEVIFNYNRTTPQFATSGVIREGGVAELKRQGLKPVLELRTRMEGTAREKRAVEAAGMQYYNIEISRAPINNAQIARFAKLVENKSNHPILVHCASANRVGAMWTLYRISKGVPAKLAIEEGRTVGLAPMREKQVRATLNLPAAD